MINFAYKSTAIGNILFLNKKANIKLFYYCLGSYLFLKLIALFSKSLEIKINFTLHTFTVHDGLTNGQTL